MKTWQHHLMKPILSWQNKSLKKWAGKESSRLNLYEETLLEISEYTGEPVETVREKHHLGPKSEPAFSIFQQQDKLTVGTVEHFYKEAKYYLYELPLWNAERARPQYLYRIIHPYLKRYGCRKVLDFGGGTGDLCLELAGQGLQVTYCDIGKEVSDFARWRFARRKLDVRMCADIGKLPEQSYDAVISFDCFEHIKGLEGVIKRLAKLIRDEGLLITGDAFEGGGLHLDENYKYHNPDVFDELLRQNGLTFVGRFAQYLFYQKQKI